MAAVRRERTASYEAEPQTQTIRIEAEPPGFYRSSGKRAFDLVAASGLLLIALPLIGVLALAILATTGAPALYAATRIGRGGRPFRMWKLRTMVRDADACISRWQASGDERGVRFMHAFKLENDPRITPLGRFLRRTSLDELPQLINVIRGDMSLVGPRPVVSAELYHYGADVPLLLSCRPGLTGLWQVSGRNDIDYPERVGVELECCQTISFRRDLSILASTLAAPLRMDGR